MRPVPDPEDLRKFVEALSSGMDGLVLAEHLIAKMVRARSRSPRSPCT